MAEKIKVLVGSSDPAFHEQVRAVSDRIELFTSEQIKERPDLIQELEVVYGGLGRLQMPQATRLRWLQTGGAGVNGLITPEMREGGLIITNARGIHAEPIAEHMFGMLLMHTRRLGQAWDQQKTRQWRGYDFGPNVSMLAGKTLGLLGVGAIGGQAARVGKAFGMRTVGLRRSGQPHPHVDRMYAEAEGMAFFRECDVLMNSLPLTEVTHHAVSWDEFRAMKQGVIIINSGRGPTIHMEALVAALREKHVGAAMLDVTDPEPLPEDHPLWTMENVYITPHYAGSHPGYQERAGRIFLENLKRYLAGEPMINVVDKREGY